MYADRLPPLLEEARLVDDQHRLVLPEMLGYIRPHVVADLIGIPNRAGDEVLQVRGRGLAQFFGELPAVLAFDAAIRPRR